MVKCAALVGVLVTFAACASVRTPENKVADRTVVIEMRDNHYEPDKLEVERGETVAFQFRNRGKSRHDAFIGDKNAQIDHEDGMRKAEDQDHGGEHMADDDDAITVEPNKTARLTYTFDERGKTMIGCHEPGHYEDGMVVTVTVK